MFSLESISVCKGHSFVVELSLWWEIACDLGKATFRIIFAPEYYHLSLFLVTSHAEFLLFFSTPGSHSLCVTASLPQVRWHEAFACATWKLQREGPRHLLSRKWLLYRNHLLLHAQP